MLLTPPNDLIPDPYSLIAQNFRVDKAGQLVTRRGSVVTQSGLNANIRSIFREPLSGITFIASNEDLFVNGVSSAGVLDASTFAVDFAAYLQYVWVLDADARLKVTVPGADVYAWQIAAPSTGATAAAGGAGNVNGDVEYVYTFANADGHESEPSAAVAITVAAKEVDLSSVDVSADPQVTKRYIYRTGGGLDLYYRVGEIADNVTTTFTDDLSAADALALGISLDEEEFGALDAYYYGMVGPYLGRLVAWGGQRVAWTPIAKPYRWPEENFEDIGTAGPIQRCTAHKRMLLIYATDSIWRFLGDPDTEPVERTNAQMGAVGTKAVVNAGQVDYFCAYDGIYRFNGDVEQKISHQIEPLFRGDSIRLAGSSFLPPLDPAYDVAMGYQPGRLLCSYRERGGSSPSVTLVYDEATERWSLHRLAGTEQGFRAMHWMNNAMLVGANSKVYALEQSQTSGGATVQQDDTTDIPVIWQTGHMDFGKPNQYKIFADVEIDYQTADENLGTPENAATLSVYASYDNGAVTLLGTISSATRTVTTFRLGASNLGQRAKTVAIRISGSTASTCTIYQVHMHWYLEPRDAKTWDSEVIEFGSAAMKDIYAFRLDVSAASDITWRVETDTPGGVMTQRATGTITATARKLVRVDLSTFLEGHRARLTLSSAGAFQVWAAEMLVREIGESIDTAAGETFLEIGPSAW